MLIKLQAYEIEKVYGNIVHRPSTIKLITEPLRKPAIRREMYLDGEI